VCACCSVSLLTTIGMGGGICGGLGELGARLQLCNLCSVFRKHEQLV
jgi:hypothetical protein